VLNVEVSTVSPGELREPLALLEEWMREGKALPDIFVEELRDLVARGRMDVFSAVRDGEVLGVAVVAYRPAISLGDSFASLEEVFVRPEAQRQGIGRALIQSIEERCVAKGISYIEVQSIEGAEPFYRAAGFLPDTEARLLWRSIALDDQQGESAES
jgi:GNAT superfamily N-acetyltransferase